MPARYTPSKAVSHAESCGSFSSMKPSSVSSSPSFSAMSMLGWSPISSTTRSAVMDNSLLVAWSYHHLDGLILNGGTLGE